MKDAGKQEQIQSSIVQQSGNHMRETSSEIREDSSVQGVFMFPYTVDYCTL